MSSEIPTVRKEILAIIRVLKGRFNNLGAEELLTLALDILQAQEEAKRG